MRAPWAKPRGPRSRRLLLPFLGSVLSRPSLQAALRIARAQDASLVPAYLAVVPHELSLEAPLGGECEGAMALLELIEQRATKAGVPVDSRIERGRSVRHALERLLEVERFDAIMLPARTTSSEGFSPDDVAWALESLPGEVFVVRPAREEEEAQSTSGP
jgi:nucleotide-binding universal stress UspA family protein